MSEESSSRGFFGSGSSGSGGGASSGGGGGGIPDIGSGGTICMLGPGIGMAPKGGRGAIKGVNWDPGGGGTGIADGVIDIG